MTRLVRSQGRCTVIVLRGRRRSEFRECQDRRGAGRRWAQGRQLRLTVDIICWWHARVRWTTLEILRSLSLPAQWHLWSLRWGAYLLLFAWFSKCLPSCSFTTSRKQNKGNETRQRGYRVRCGRKERKKERNKGQRKMRRRRGRAKRGSPWGPLKITSYTLFQTDHLR